MTLNKCFEKIVYHTKIYIMMKLMLLIYSRKSYIFYTIGQTLQRFTFEKYLCALHFSKEGLRK
jgi:hypothetical protein